MSDRRTGPVSPITGQRTNASTTRPPRAQRTGPAAAGGTAGSRGTSGTNRAAAGPANPSAIRGTRVQNAASRFQANREANRGSASPITGRATTATRATSTAKNDYGIPAGRAKDGATAKGKDGVNRRYDAASKSWKIVR